jgi:hypothetical protein
MDSKLMDSNAEKHSTILQRAHLEIPGRFTVSTSVCRHFEGKLKVKPL